MPILKRLLAIVLIAASLWAGYWFMGENGLKRGLEAWLQGRRAAGWQADVADLSVVGFPNRFDTTFNEFVLADPDSGWAWQAPFFQLLALSYQPNHVIAVWPNSQTLATPLQKFQISSASMQASLRLGSSTDLPLERANLVADTLLITDEAGKSTAMTALRVAVERLPGSANPFLVPRGHNGTAAVAEVLSALYGKAPYQVRTGGSIPVMSLLLQELGVHGAVMAFGLNDENIHAPNEFYRLSSYRKSQTAYCMLLERLGQG